MAELIPFPFEGLARRMFRELETENAIFDLPAGRFFLGSSEHEFTVRFHGHEASSPLGPAAGPHTQMAQNIVLAWLGGSRILELKTVQIMDELEIPRPCIDMRTIGFNAEWSQELKLEQSLEEYVKAAMLIEMLESSGKLALEPGFHSLVYDLSVGYDLEGIKTDRVQTFIKGMMDASATVEALRGQIPDELAKYRDLDFTTALADTVTLSTFHGCPPDEIERIIEYLMDENGLHCVVKFNPMLLGAEEARQLLHDALGYEGIHIPDSAFERDATWEQAIGIVERLQRKGLGLGLGLGVKFSNTLIVENNQGFLPDSEEEVYLSGAPLHVLAMHLVRRLRRHFGDAVPISFSAGIDQFNFPDAAALGLAPITVCSDLLKKGGYGRLKAYYAQLDRRMEEVGAGDPHSFALQAYGLAEAALKTLEPRLDEPQQQACLAALESGGDLGEVVGAELLERWLSATHLLNTEHYVEGLAADPRYSQARNRTPPRKIGSELELFDCVTCDLCVPVCPNDANFTYKLDESEFPITKIHREGKRWRWQEEGSLELERRHQIGNVADFCNECGNCDVFCPEDGGPYIIKPRFFVRLEEWQEFSHLDGFQIERTDKGDRMHGRFEGVEFHLIALADTLTFSGTGFEVSFERSDPAATLCGEASDEVDLTYCFIMDALRRALLDTNQVTYLNT